MSDLERKIRRAVEEAELSKYPTTQKLSKVRALLAQALGHELERQELTPDTGPD